MNVKNINSVIAKEMYDTNVKFIDVREQNEHRETRIPNTTLIPMSEIENRFMEIPQNEEIVIYCRSGSRSGMLITQLMQHGYTNLYNLEGGIIEWSQNNYPVEQG